MTRESFEGIAKAILETAEDFSARLIMCGQRGRGALRSTLLGSLSHSLASHTDSRSSSLHKLPPATVESDFLRTPPAYPWCLP